MLFVVVGSFSGVGGCTCVTIGWFLVADGVLRRLVVVNGVVQGGKLIYGGCRW